MHQRTWLSVLTLPLVVSFTYPMVVRHSDPPKSDARPASQDPLAGLSDIQDVLALVRENYVDPPDMEKVVSGGIQGTLERVHPLNAYLSPEDLRLPDPGPAGPGLTLRKSQIYAQVVAVTPNGPAARAGIQAGDVIRKLDGQSIGALSAWALERHLRGAEGSELNLLWYDNSVGSTKKVTLKREKPTRPSLSTRKDAKATVVTLPDLTPGRAAELKGLLASLDAKLPLVLDLHGCATGDLEETAKVAGMLLGRAPLATVQEAGKADRALETAGEKGPAFPKVAAITGFGTNGCGEVLAAALKKQAVPTFGERTAAMGLERTRFLLRQGGAVEIVTRRWVGAGGEKLDRQGFVPEFPLRPAHGAPGAVEDDLLPRILEQLDKKPEPKPETRGALKTGALDSWWRSPRPEPQGREFA